MEGIADEGYAFAASRPAISYIFVRSLPNSFPIQLPVFPRILAVALAALAMVPLARVSEAQQRPPARFFIHTVGDTTFSFSVPSDPWVKPGMEGRAIDPMRRDSLVARFRVAKVEWGEAMAVITGQTTAVTNNHVAILRMPEPPWYKRKQFWLGLVAGAGLGAGVVAATR